MKFFIETNAGKCGEVTIYDRTRLLAPLGEGYAPEDDETSYYEYKYYKYTEITTVDYFKPRPCDEEPDEGATTSIRCHCTDCDTYKVETTLDGYYEDYHIILPTESWLSRILSECPHVLEQYEYIYFTKEDENGIKIYVAGTTPGDFLEITDVTEIIKNIEGEKSTTAHMTKIDIFSMARLEECYINYAKKYFDDMMKHCSPQCEPIDASEAKFARDFLWMTINILTYLVQQQQYCEAQRILDQMNYCGGFCKQEKDNGCGCKPINVPRGCGCRR